MIFTLLNYHPKDCYYLNRMNRKLGLVFLIFGVLFSVSCNSEKRRMKRKNKQESHASLIRLSHYFSELEDEVSFPVWFNDSLVRKHKIKRLIRKTYSLNQDSTQLEFPKSIQTYDFEPTGAVAKYTIAQFYENVEVSCFTFTYPKQADEYGFAPVTTTMSEEMRSRSRFKIFNKEDYSPNFLVYENELDGTFLMCMLKEKLFGPLSVDSILKPSSFDYVVLGSPKDFQKKYQVENMVNERNVTALFRDRKTKNLNKIHFEKSPFFYHRTVQYDKTGVCQGFIDSTFSIDRFISARKSFWILDEAEKPVKMIHKTNTPKNELQNTQIETFEYEYYD